MEDMTDLIAECSVGTGILSPELKRPGREVEQYPPARVEVNYEWICTSTPHLHLRNTDMVLF